jgi:large subunit ribosomal protein L17
MKLSRNYNQRKALKRTLLNAFVVNGHLTTTIAKAKLIKPLIDRLITKAKVNTVATRRLLAKELARVDSANRLVDVIAPLFPDKNSGYATSSKVKIRRGDAVTMVELRLTADLPAPVMKEKTKAIAVGAHHDAPSKPKETKKAKPKI